MDILQGSPAGLRAAARDVAAQKAAYEAFGAGLTDVLAHADDAGNFRAGHQLRQVLVTMRTTARDAVARLNDAQHAIEALADRLEDLDLAARRAAAIPTLAGSAMALQYRREADQERATTAAALLRCLPDGFPGRQVEYPGVGTTMKHVFERGIKEPVEGLFGLAKFGWDTSLFRAAVDPDGFARTMDEVTLNVSTLYNAVINDRFPDGSTGARQVVKEALGGIPGDVLNNDLIDTDPAAWWMLYGLTALSLLSGAGGAKVGSRVLTSLNKGMGKAGDLSKFGAVAVNGARVPDSASPMTKLLADYPGLLGRLERPISPVQPGTWTSRRSGDHTGRLGIEDIVHELAKVHSPGIVKTKTGHDVIDLMDVSLIDPGTGRIISVKSLDPALSSYRANPSSVGSHLFSDAEKLRNWATPGTQGGTGVPFIRDPDAFGSLGAERGTVFFMGEDLLTRDLYFALPEDGLNAAQAASLQNAISRIENANTGSGITIHVHLLEVPR